MAKNKDKKTRTVRTRKQRIAAWEKKISDERAKDALEDLKTAVKDGRVSKDDTKEYRKLLRFMKTMEKAPDAFLAFGLDSEAAAAAKLRDELIDKLKKMLTGDPVESDDNDESEEEEEESEEEESEDDDDEDDDDDDEDDDDDDDFDDDDDDDDED